MTYGTLRDVSMELKQCSVPDVRNCLDVKTTLRMRFVRDDNCVVAALRFEISKTGLQ